MAINYNKWNVLMGWGVFLLSLLVYSLTVEPTVSFWDSGEYIASSAKLQIAHPPGAPLFQMIGAFFAQFALEADQVAKMVNYMSVLSSAFTILFLFWTITNLTKKLVAKDEGFTDNKAFMVITSGLVGSLTYTFSDSFWFNAVETEVYAMASLIMASLIYLGIRWTDDLDKPRGNRWLLLITFIIGLTFGVQFMGFLAIPTIVLMYFFKKHKSMSPKKFIVANIVAIGILLLIFKFSLTYVLKLFGWSEVFFVNNFGLPFNSGTILMGLFLITLFWIGLRYTKKKGFVNANTSILALAFLFMGFSTWLMMPIRANAHVVINENDPSDARAPLAYYNREQYPSAESPFYGAYYSNRFGDFGEPMDDKPKYEKDEALGRYVVANKYKDANQKPDKRHVGLLPRLWSDQHAENYIAYFGPLDFEVKPKFKGNKEIAQTIAQIKTGFQNGDLDASDYVRALETLDEYITVHPPTLWQNLEYMLSYQFGYMYFRYLMWNFTGRQNDLQGRYDGNGEWLSGIQFLDEARLGNQKYLPQDDLKNKARNTYYFLPLILGLLGLVFQLSKNPKQFWVFFVFFLFTGLAIQFYTNPTIFQPRERDYSLVGSFYVFSLWIGMGVYGLYEMVKSLGRYRIVSRGLAVICLACAPVLMAFQNWDDHDRSNKFTARAAAKAYLDSVQENAGGILFTIGDIDTFPLWYAQDIENYRTDVRVVVSGYLSTDWYIDQMKRKAHESDAIPSQMTHDKYHYGARDVVYYRPIQGLKDKRWEIKDFMNWIASDHPRTKLGYLFESNGADLSQYSDYAKELVYYPTNKIRIPVNKENVLSSGLVKAEDADLIVDYIDIDLPETGLTKNRIMMLDILANNDWQRPIYFSGGSYDDAEYIWMKDYLQLEGLAYKLIPIKTPNNNSIELGRIDTELMYQKVMDWEWGNSGSPEIYHDPETRKHFGVIVRSTVGRLTEQLIREGKVDKARHIVELIMEKVPVEYYGHYVFVEPYLDGYYKIGETTKARELFYFLKSKYQDKLKYIGSLTLDRQYDNVEGLLRAIEGYKRILGIVESNQDNGILQKQVEEFNAVLSKFELLEY